LTAVEAWEAARLGKRIVVARKALESAMEEAAVWVRDHADVAEPAAAELLGVNRTTLRGWKSSQ